MSSEALVRIPHEPSATEPPPSVTAFLIDAERRIEEFRAAREDEKIPAFVASNTWIAWHALRRVREDGLAPGNSFIEWGSGFGVVAGIAALAGYEARGIEIEPSLVARSRDLLAEHGIDAVIEHGTYVPPGAFVDDVRILEFAPADADVVYAYPWPAEADLTLEIFRRFGREGAILITYSGGTEISIHRKTCATD